ncbi:DUF417 family protein [Ferrimonas sp. YFM]|uniref:DUF417 family protein n=1 Tax=Ferrimonas sp. YFM TaxID=3028878 RepID=UPI002572C0A1|nr:DUF417 family protein [Ferrimonas sp. YFM]BDY03704.1 hypothetical protein F0521_07450 [Ferrimonas sp. YFM]
MELIRQFHRANLSENSLIRYLVVVTSGYLIWMGLLKLSESELKMIQYWLGGSSLWAPVLQWLPVKALATAMLVTETLFGGLLLSALWGGRFAWVGALGALLIFALNFGLLFTNPIFVADLGGFPWLGAGQGLIKYLAMFAVALYLFAHLAQTAGVTNKGAFLKGWASRLALAGIVLVMGWIGFLKFQPYEAQGIVDLMESNWLFSWTYLIWDVQGASKFIGVVELVFMVGILAFPFSVTLGRLGALGIALTAFGTLSFLFSLPGWSADAYFPLLNSSGVFIIKDQLLLAAAAILWHKYPSCDIAK